jgi:protein involved in temperature-dependent protein secretion
METDHTMNVRTGIFLALCLTLASGAVNAAGLRKGYAMCHDRPSLERLLRASTEQDDDAFAHLMGRSCTLIRGNEKVRILARTPTLARLAALR